MKVTIYHNPKYSTSRNVLALIRERASLASLEEGQAFLGSQGVRQEKLSRIEPEIIEYLKTPLSRAEIAALVKKMDVPVRDVVRAKEPLYAELKLDKASDSQLLDAMAKHSILLDRPIVTTPKTAKLCRPSEMVGEIL